MIKPSTKSCSRALKLKAKAIGALEAGLAKTRLEHALDDALDANTQYRSQMLAIGTIALNEDKFGRRGKGLRTIRVLSECITTQFTH